MDGTMAAPVQPISMGSFDEFYRSKRDHIVKALVLSLGNRELGIEAADEAMTRAYQHWANVHSYANPTGWVYRVGMNWARTKLRKTKREIPSIYVDSSIDQQPQVEPGLDAALAALSDKHRRVVVLRYYLDWSIEEIAQALRLPKGTVKSRLHRAMANLQSALGEPS